MSTRSLSCPEAEANFVGALVLDSPRIAEVQGLVDVEDLESPRLRHVFRALRDLDQQGEPVDTASVVSWLNNDPEASKQAPGAASGGWADFVVECERQVTSSAHVQHHARVVRETAWKRRATRKLHGLADAVESVHAGQEGSLAGFQDRLETEVYRLTEDRLGLVASSDLDTAISEMLVSIEAGEMDRGIRTGFVALDEHLLGLYPTEVTVLAARPAVGKTALGLQLALNVARAGGSVLFFSLEMTRQQIAGRLSANLTRIDSRGFRTGELDSHQLDQVARARAESVEVSRRIFLVESADFSIAGLRAEARRRCARAGLDLIVVDYLQLLRLDHRTANRNEEVGEVSRMLKGLARELRVPVVALCQLNRQADSGRPGLHHLRDSGQLEQDADQVVMLWVDDEDGPIRCAVEKNRHGPVGTFSFSYLREFGRIGDYAGDE